MRQSADLTGLAPRTGIVKSTKPNIAESVEKVMLLLDWSGSMEAGMDPHSSYAHGGEPTRKDVVRDGVIAITAASEPSITAYGVTLFSEHGYTLVDYTTNYLKAQAFRDIRSLSTMLDEGLRKSLEGTPNRIILLSDGAASCGVEAVIVYVVEAIQRHIIIDTIAIGGADDTLLRDIAERTGGVFVRANCAEDLIEHFEKLETRAYALLEDHT